MPDELPLPFGRYVLTRLIGEGGMAEVYQASVRVAEGLTKWVVIKKIRTDFADDRDFTRMFVDEAKIALSLNHANIVQVFDFGQIRGTFYLAMELIEGVDLMRLFHTLRAQEDSFPAVIAAYIAHQVASGLAYAHRKCDDYGAPLGFSTYHSLQVSFNRQIKKGTSVFGNYVWSKALTNTISSMASKNNAPFDYYNLKLDKTFSDGDIPHALKLTFFGDLHFGRGKAQIGRAHV